MIKYNKFKLGHIPWNKGLKGIYSVEYKEKISKNHANFSGKNNPRYKNGYTLKKYYCKNKNCNKQITWASKTGYCMSCSKKHMTKKTKLKMSLSAKNRLINPENHNNYIDGRSFLPYSIEFTKFKKEQIKQRDNYQCQNCSMTEEEHIVVIGYGLTIHHIDYDKMNCDDKDLITLCLSCNIRANYNRRYWQEYYERKIEEKYNKNEKSH